MAQIQVPPAVGSSGQFLDAIIITSSSLRQIIALGDPASTGNFAAVGTDGNQRVVTASSGVVQVLTTGTYLVVSASSGLIQLTSAVALSSGTVTLSSNPTVISASSGNVGTFASTGRQYSVFAFNASSSNSITNVAAVQTLLYGWNVGNQTTSASASIKLYNSTAPTAGSTTNLIVTIPIPGGSAGAGNNLMLPQGVNFSSAFTIVVTGNFAATSTGTTHSAGDVVGTFYTI